MLIFMIKYILYGYWYGCKNLIVFYLGLLKNRRKLILKICNGFYGNILKVLVFLLIFLYN